MLGFVNYLHHYHSDNDSIAVSYESREARARLMLEACSVNSVATSEKYFRILIQRLGLGMQPLCAWMAWIRAISLAISLRGRQKEQGYRHGKTSI